MTSSSGHNDVIKYEKIAKKAENDLSYVVSAQELKNDIYFFLSRHHDVTRGPGWRHNHEK